jgi:hypothetical protein
MDKGQRIRLKEKNAEDNWTLKSNEYILKCTKCRKYNTIFNTNNKNNTNNTNQKYMNCSFCGNPNYIK